MKAIKFYVGYSDQRAWIDLASGYQIGDLIGYGSEYYLIMDTQMDNDMQMIPFASTRMAYSQLMDKHMIHMIHWMV